MENYEDFYKTICRVCLSYDNSQNMVPLTDKSSEDGLSCYGKAVLVFSKIQINKDSLPDKMCEKCLFLLKQAIIFKKTSESAHERLTKFVRKYKPSNTDFKEKLSDYVIFLSNIPNKCYLKPSETCSLSKEVNINKKKQEISVKNETSLEMDFSNEYDDFFPYEEAPLTSRTEEEPYDIDKLLSDMEKVAEMKSTEIVYPKKYPKLKIQAYTCSKPKRKWKKNVAKENNDLQCKICMKVLANVTSYAAHMRRHSGGQYICEQCGRTFVTNAELQYHLASTHDIGPQFICKECGYKAPKKYELMEHQRLHTGERPYACDKCGLTFRRRFIWKKHALYHMEKTIQCLQCPRKFYQRGELIAHVNGVHERMYVYACSHCDVTYAKPSTVRRHMTEKHGITRESQGKVRRINFAGKSTSNVWHYDKGRPTLQEAAQEAA